MHSSSSGHIAQWLVRFPPQFVAPISCPCKNHSEDNQEILSQSLKRVKGYYFNSLNFTY